MNLKTDLEKINNSLINIIDLQKNQATKDDLKSLEDEVLKALGRLPTKEDYKQAFSEL